MGKDDGIDVYQKHWPLIVKLFQVDKTHCVHHGYYEKGIHTHVQSVLNMNDFVSRLLALDPKGNQVKHILDAGCGIGGTVVYLAKKYPTINWTGITVVTEHVEMAKKLAQENQVSRKTDFLVKDFINTDFPSNHFDAIYLLESLCYAQKKNMLIHELYRILKPKGKLVIIDVFLTNVQLNPLLKKIYLWFCKGWGLPDLISSMDFIEMLKTEGFFEIVTRDLTKNVTRSILRGDVLSIPYLFSIFRNKIFLGKSYRIEEDTQFFGALPVLTTILGIKKAITYNAVTALK
jgi:tocopherol O-methyltransferase